jgi:hypothetical protein
VQTRSQAYRPALIAAVVVLGLVLLVLARFPPAGVEGPSAGGASASATASGSPFGTSTGSPASGSPAVSPSESPADVVLLAVGDIAACEVSADEQVAELAARLPGTIALLGDNVYPDGSSTDYANCFDPDWGALRDRLRPVPGNHEYETKAASAYFSYFGAAAGTPGEGWHSYDVGAWHVIALNSECGAIGGCGSGSPQLAWLRADLAAHPATCTLAYWHHPRYSSGQHGDNDMTDGFWAALSDAGADLVLSGHDHDYERMAPVDGLRSFVVGTGGRSLYTWPGGPGPFTEVRANDTYGLLELTLGATDYAWRFVPASGGSFTDSGSATCR